MAGGGGNKKRFQYCTDSSGAILYLRALQGNSGRGLIDPTLQDNVVIPSNFFQYIHHVGCAINLHSIINSGLIPGGKFEQKTDGILHVCESYEQKKTEIRAKLTRKHRVLHGTIRRSGRNIKTGCVWVDIKLAQCKGLKFYQTRSNAIILYDTLPAYCIPKAIMMETGEIIYEKIYASPRLPPKISFRDNWMQELGSEVARGSENSQQTGPKTKNPILRTVRPG